MVFLEQKNRLPDFWGPRDPKGSSAYKGSAPSSLTKNWWTLNKTIAMAELTRSSCNCCYCWPVSLAWKTSLQLQEK